MQDVVNVLPQIPRDDRSLVFSHAASVLEKGRSGLCHCTTSKIKDETNDRLRGCATDCRDGAGGGSGHGTRGDITAKSLWELSINPKSSDLGKSRRFNICDWPCGEPSWYAETYSKPVPMNRVR